MGLKGRSRNRSEAEIPRRRSRDSQLVIKIARSENPETKDLGINFNIIVPSGRLKHL